VLVPMVALGRVRTPEGAGRAAATAIWLFVASTNIEASKTRSSAQLDRGADD
jgi:hypothetical protein